MEEFHDGNRIESHSPEIHHLIADRVRIELHSHRMLHPAVRNENPESGNGCSYSCEPGGSQMEAPADLVPSEEHHGDESSLHKEGQDTLNGKRSAENVPDKPGIIAPVGSELELKNETRGNSHGEIDSEEFHPELGGLLPEFVFFDEVDCLHHCHNHRQS